MRSPVLLLLCMLDGICGFPGFQARIPNGANVRDPCDQSVWQGVGHQAKGGGGLRNPFGLAFARNGLRWTAALCKADSDGDGQSNGRELGDPDCVWRPGSTPASQPLGHPGICENLNTPECRAKNTGGWFTCASAGLRCPAISAPGVRQVQFRMPRTTIPATETTFMCVNLEIPSDRDYHVIADTGILDNQNIVHHMVVFACESEVTAAELQNPVGSPYQCEMLPDPKCQDIITGWQSGISGFCHPDNVGFSVGTNRAKYLTLQVHWINPLKRTDLTDTSGMALFLTPNLRQFNLSTFRLGDVSFSIPPKEKSFVVEANCASECTTQELTGPIHIYQSFDHMHYAGKEIKVTLKRQGRGQETTLSNNAFFNFQTTVFHKMNGVQIQPGDSLHTTCRYNTESRNTTTFFGWRAIDEMCFAFLQFYPAENAVTNRCISSGGLPGCLLNSPNGVIDGCSISFTTGQDFTIITKFLKDNCNPLKCLEECINVVKAIRKHACFWTENIRKHLEERLLQMNLLETLAQFHSCDVEIAKEETMCSGKMASKRTKSTRCLCNKRPFFRWIAGP